jgi:hypothetical protein
MKNQTQGHFHLIPCKLDISYSIYFPSNFLWWGFARKISHLIYNATKFFSFMPLSFSFLSISKYEELKLHLSNSHCFWHVKHIFEIDWDLCTLVLIALRLSWTVRVSHSAQNLTLGIVLMVFVLPYDLYLITFLDMMISNPPHHHLQLHQWD